MQEAGQAGVDHWLAILSGPRTWIDDDAGRSGVQRLAGGLQILAALCASSAVVALWARNRPAGTQVVARLAPFGLGLAMVGMIARPLIEGLGVERTASAHWRNVPTRGLLALLLLGSLYAMTPGWPALVSWPLGVAIGCDVAATTSLIGWTLSPLGWWTAFLRSPLHLGVIGGLVGAAVANDSGGTVANALPVYAVIQTWVFVAAMTMWWLRRIQVSERTGVLDAIRQTAHLERRRSAHWLHDDLLAELRLVTIKVQSGKANLAEVEGLLDDLDFQLRVRQLDQLLDSGTIRVGEALQPYIRRAQNFGVEIVAVPSYDTASLTLEPEAGRLFSHAAAILTSNALNAGAHRLGFHIDGNTSLLTLTITDDAGGFDASELPAGRGLWTLAQDLGATNVTVHPVDGGSRVEAVIPLHTKQDHGATAAG